MKRLAHWLVLLYPALWHDLYGPERKRMPIEDVIPWIQCAWRVRWLDGAGPAR